jgi:hypothetical protein
MVRGDSVTISFTHALTAGDVTEALIYVRSRPDGELVLSVKRTLYPTQWTIGTGTGSVTLIPDNTAAADGGVLWYDIELSTATVTQTVQRGRLAILTDMATEYAAISPTDYYDDTVTDQLLTEWTAAEAYKMSSITYDGTYPEVPALASVIWPDGSAGVFTATTISSPGRIDAYTITHTTTGKTVTQTAVTRSAAGLVTAKPDLAVT